MKSIYKGFSTQEINKPATVYDNNTGKLVTTKALGKKYTLTDQNLVIRDLLNALSIKQGEKPGNPSYGTSIWGYIFEPNIDDVHSEMEQELRRVIGQDPRIVLNTVNINGYQNYVTIRMEVSFSPFNQATVIGLSLDKSSGQVSQIG
jgi:phage baseplate assembly protein W